MFQKSQTPRAGRERPRARAARCAVLALALLGASALALAQSPASGAAMGLIVQLKPAAEAAVTGGTEKPAAASLRGAARAQAQAQWERSSRLLRHRIERLARETGTPLHSAGEAGSARLMRFDRPLEGVALEQAMRRVRLHPDVAWVEPDVRVQRLQAASVVPDDSFFARQWHLQGPDARNPVALNLPAAWARQTGAGRPVVMAVVDSGVRFDHPDLAGRLLPGYDLIGDLDVANDGDGRDPDASDPGDWVSAAEAATPAFAGCEVRGSSWHGLFIAGQLAAASQNGLGVAGLHWDGRVLPVRVAGKCGAWVSDLLDGLRWAAGLPVQGLPINGQPARVINLSFGGDAPCSPAYQQAIDDATQAGALVVVAAGNASQALTRPADCQRVMAVTAVRQDGAKAAYASFGAQVALAAPGGSPEADNASLLLSTDNGGSQSPAAPVYGFKQGTSFAAPQAAGVAGLMLAVNPALTPAQLMARMQAGVRPHAFSASLPLCGPGSPRVCNCTPETCGRGLLDAAQAVQLATGPAAVIEPMGRVAAGSRVALDGRASAAIPGSQIVTHRWVQLAGPALALAEAGSALAQATLPQVGRYVFQLQVTDDLGRRGEDSVTVTAEPRESLAALDGPGASGGGGSSGLWWGLALWCWVGAVLRQRLRGS
jgi:serine protease